MNRNPLIRQITRLMLVLGVILSLLLAGGAPSEFMGIRTTTTQVAP